MSSIATTAPATTGADRATLDAGLDALGIALPREARDKLIRYVDLLAKWNRTFNLTAIREPSRMITHHLLDALAVLPHLPAEHETQRLLDVGSGGGVPGIPIAIARPAWRVAMIDASGKKATFLAQAAAELGLANVEAVGGRVEDYRPGEPFDVVISRAFSDLETFAASSARHLASGGVLVAMKGVHPDEEIAALPAAFEVTATPRLDVPGLDAARHLVLMRRKQENA